jgi:hypothetical protein
MFTAGTVVPFTASVTGAEGPRPSGRKLKARRGETDSCDWL